MKASNSTAAFTVEQLEERKLMSYQPTDLADVAAHYPTHQGQTILYLNFDGGTINDAQTGNKTYVVAPYVPEIDSTFNANDEQLTAVTNRQSAIEDILYHVQEIFSPFNVRVELLQGAGNYYKGGGNTTVFIGDNDAKNGVNDTYSGVTPEASVDFPGANGTNYTHIPNSDPYDLAFVDPVTYTYNLATKTFQDATALSDLAIARDVAHEAGHTFGLAHVTMPDGTASSADDLMSYNTYNNKGFQDVSLPITSANGTLANLTGVFPTVEGVANGDIAPFQVLNQNSFQYLNAALGFKNLRVDSYPFLVADPTSISTDYATVVGTPQALTPTSVVTNLLSNFGDYDAYSFTNVAPKSIIARQMATPPTVISLVNGNANGGSVFDPQILLYSSDGKQLIAAVHGTRLQAQLPYGTSYKVVVSGYLGNSAGQYTLSFSKAPLSTLLAPISAAPVAPTPPVSIFSPVAPSPVSIFAPVWGPVVTSEAKSASIFSSTAVKNTAR